MTRVRCRLGEGGAGVKAARLVRGQLQRGQSLSMRGGSKRRRRLQARQVQECMHVRKKEVGG
jgi:hypothetical protein